MVEKIIIPDDIMKLAIDTAAAISPETPWEPIAAAILYERQANANEVEHWRGKWRELSFSRDAGAEVAENCREYAKVIVGVNATWVDDDLRVLAHLADIAVRNGLYQGLNPVCRISIEALAEKRRREEDA